MNQVHEWVKSDQGIFNKNQIAEIKTERFKTELTIEIVLVNGSVHTCKDIRALEALYQIKPSALEGLPWISFAKHAWAYHNLIAHPLMYIACRLGYVNWGIKVHDHSVPAPLGFKNKKVHDKK